MLKCSLLCMIVWGMIVSPVVVHADFLVEPKNNFYEKNSEECVLLERNFRVNGEDGKVSVEKAPDSKIEVATLVNDKIVYVNFSCLYDGEYWGIVSYDNNGNAGWVEMNQLLVLYDYVAFAEEHVNEFYQYVGDFKEIKETGEIIIWTWPNSGNSLGSVMDIDTDNFPVLYAFRDDQGREWGFVSYSYGIRNFWVCISDPVNLDIPAFNPEPTPMKWESDTEHIEINKTDNNVLVFVIALVVVLVMGTAILIKVFWGQQKEKKQGEESELS